MTYFKLSCIICYHLTKTKTKFFVNCTNIWNHYNSKYLKEFNKFGIAGWAMAKFNIKVENIIEKRRIKTEKNNDEIFNFLSKMATAGKIWSQIFGIPFFKIWIWKLHFHLPSKFVNINSGKNFGLLIFSVTKLENNDTSGNKDSAVCFLLTYNF